jgi:hypothetical protein
VSTEQQWKDRLRGARPPADAGFTLRVLAALPPRRRGERIRARVLVLAAVLAALLMFATVAPMAAAVNDPRRLIGLVVACVTLAALAFWGVLTVAE